MSGSQASGASATSGPRRPWRASSRPTSPASASSCSASSSWRRKARSPGCHPIRTATRPRSRRCSIWWVVAGQAYRLSEAKGRRDYNQAFFDGIFLDTEDDDLRPVVTKVTRTPVLSELQEHRSRLTNDVDQIQQHRRGLSPDGVGVSNYALLVELRGIEPLTPSMRTRCATGLRHSPSEEELTVRFPRRCRGAAPGVAPTSAVDHPG